VLHRARTVLPWQAVAVSSTILAPALRGNAVLTGLVVGLVANLMLARVAPGVSWLWWNPAGFVVTCATALAIGRIAPRLELVGWPQREARVLIGAFLVMLAVLIGASASAG